MQEFSGTDYVKIDLANQFGLDRLLWADRIHWVNNNLPNLASFVTQAKNEIGYAKALRTLFLARKGHVTNHTMGLDATTSGVQMMAAMSGCHSSARAVNLIDTGQRKDLYNTVSKNMNENHGLDTTRDSVKKSVMTYFYGSEAVPKQVFGEGDALVAFYKTMQEKLQGPYELMKLFQSFWDSTATSYSWAMPDGHVVRVPVTETIEKGMEIDEAKHLRFTYRAEVVRPQKKGKSLAANIVHSVDGWVARSMVKKAKALGFHLSPIHDCFYSHPNNMNQIRELYRKCLADVCRMNLVTSILSQICGRRVVYNKLSNDLDSYVMQSEYALS